MHEKFSEALEKALERLSRFAKKYRLEIRELISYEYKKYLRERIRGLNIATELFPTSQKDYEKTLREIVWESLREIIGIFKKVFREKFKDCTHLR